MTGKIKGLMSYRLMRVERKTLILLVIIVKERGT